MSTMSCGSDPDSQFLGEIGRQIGGETGPAPQPEPTMPRSLSVAADSPDPVGELARELGPDPFALIVLFVSLEAALGPLLDRMAQRFPGTQIVGCTTAGEINATGYASGQIVALAFPAAGFVAAPVLFEDIDQLDTRRTIAKVLDARQALSAHVTSHPHDAAILLVDGLSGQEEALVAALSSGLGQVQMIGGSAGDAGEFRNASVFSGRRVLQNAAILCLLRSKGEMRDFSLDHTRASAARMIVTAADPASRAALRINDEPAAQEYARLIGLPVEALSSHVFATHPVLVRAGGRYHARAIRHVGAGNALVFFSAVAEGMVLTVSEPGDMAAHLKTELGRLSQPRAPALILGFDCIFRRIDAEGRQQATEVSRLLARHRVIGFSTYGEQYGGLHVNQTLTGIAFYPPEQTG
ncbi:FIST N-terminal domain-containing protein [Paracoccus aminophilus]|uniref:GfdT protein n=1 Tax=Paracoccus aminophilus JCM 7686 TaxID=1367847 RepID=S5XJA5_PARAH|nr:FIST N-terminal domain-containing protein [Paracoccus aminophilus]AGT07269.1 hypothetical protein JCM7686_0158 [Paracoccus aminophilus JCM 7686]